jgi:hypothetical protein
MATAIFYNFSKRDLGYDLPEDFLNRTDIGNGIFFRKAFFDAVVDHFFVKRQMLLHVFLRESRKASLQPVKKLLFIHEHSPPLR